MQTHTSGRSAFRLLPCVLLLLAPLRAEAFGMGTTIALPTGGAVGAFGPTLDLMFDPIILQIHATETLQAAFDGDLFLGANLYVGITEMPVAGAWNAVIQPGGGVDLYGNPADVAISGQCRFGIQAGGGGGGGAAAAPTPAPAPPSTVPGYTPGPIAPYSTTTPAASASSGRAGFGVYIVPEIGFVTNGGNEELYAGGGLQISVWFPM